MVHPGWALVGIPMIFLGRGSKDKTTAKYSEDTKPLKDENGEPTFACERVCTSSRLLRKLGGLAPKDVTPGTCVTVCGTSPSDSCAEACQRAVCSGNHQVPQWNEKCYQRCQDQCLKGRTGGLHA